MTRQLQFQKWTVYSLALLLVLLLDCALFPQLPVAGVCPVLLPLAVTAVAVMEGSTPGAVTGLVLGLIWVLGYGGGYGARIFVLTLAGLLAGSAAQYMFSRSLGGYLLCSCGVLLALEIWQVGIRLFLRKATLAQLATIAASEFCYTICFAPLIYLLFRQVYHRVGGTKLA